MIRLVVLILLVSVPAAFAKKEKDPNVEARKDFVHRWVMQAEQSGYPCARWGGADVQGKQKDKFVLLITNAPVSQIIQLEQACVETRKVEMRMLGFREIEIRSDAYSATFPDGIWRVPMN